MPLSTPVLSSCETLAAKCLIDAGLVTQRVRLLDDLKASSTGDALFQAEREAIRLRTRLFDSAQELVQAAVPPEHTLTQGLSASIMDLTAFQYISRWKVAEGVPVARSISYRDLAMKIGLDEAQLKRILRYAMTKGIFVEVQQDKVCHTESSLLLLQDDIATLNRYTTNRGFPVASSFNEALEKWGHGSQEPNETAFNASKNTDLAMFDYYEKHPAYAADFHNVMKSFTKTPTLSHDHIKGGFDWSCLSFATVVDVGGSLGHCGLAILEANPTVSCIVQDLPHIIARATNPSTSIVPDHLSKRISFQEHSFWDPQPIKADVYFMRMIFHDWPKKYSKKILLALLQAMRPGARLLIMDYVTLPYGRLSPGDEHRMRIRDMQMMIMHNALERDEEEWKELFAESDSRLRLVAIRTPPGSALSLIEVVLDASPQEAAVDQLPCVTDSFVDFVQSSKDETTLAVGTHVAE